MVDTIGLSARIATHVAECDAAGLPATTIHAAERALLDGLGVMLGASGLCPEVTPFVDFARTGGVGQARILGYGASTSAHLAAFANGAMAHALDFEDAFDAAPSHPNASLIPAVLAIVQDGPPVSGRELLAAIAIGCDLVCRIGLSLRREMEAGGWYPPPILGAFGAVAAAGRLRGLGAAQMLDAFSLLLCQVTMPGEIKHSRDTVIRAVREAFPAQAAVQASALAAAGVHGFEQPFEGRAGFFRLYADGQYDADVLLEGLGQRFWIEQLSFKRWPACRGTHAFIEAAQVLRARHAIDPAAIAAIVAVGGAAHVMLVEPAERKAAPSTAIDAKFSIPFTTAAAFIDADVTLDSFDEAAVRDPAKRALARLVRFERHAHDGPEAAAAGSLRVTLADGTMYEHRVDVPAGDPTRPLDDAVLQAKFRDCVRRARHAPSEADTETLLHALWTLDQAEDARAALASL